MKWLESITSSKDMNLSKLWETVKDRESWQLQSVRSQRVGHDLASEQQQQQRWRKSKLLKYIYIELNNSNYST